MILIEESVSVVTLKQKGYHMVKSCGDKLFLAGSTGISVFKEDLGTITFEKRIEDCSIACVEIWEDRNLLFAIQHNPSRNREGFSFLVFDMKLNLIKQIKFNNETQNYPNYSKDSHSETNQFSTFHRRDNLIIWNYGDNIFLVDLYNYEYKVLPAFFLIEDVDSNPLLFLPNLKKQLLLGYSQSTDSNSKKIFCNFADDRGSLFKSKDILQISDKFSICKEFTSIAECGDNLFLLGGSAILKDKIRRPFLILAALDKTLSPISGNIIDVEEAEKVTSILALQDERGYTVCAGAHGWAFMFKVVNNQLNLLQKFSLKDLKSKQKVSMFSPSSFNMNNFDDAIDHRESNSNHQDQEENFFSYASENRTFVSSSIVYINSFLFLLDKDSNLMI